MFSDFYAPLYDIAEPDGDYTIMLICEIHDSDENVTFSDVYVERFENDNTRTN